MNADTRRRAQCAIRFLKLLTLAREGTDDIRLSGGLSFDIRSYDNCFEASDGAEVVVLIMQAYQRDEALRRAFRYGLSSRFVDLDGWTKILAEWEARQPATLPLAKEPLHDERPA